MTCHFFIICPEFVTENLFGILIKRGEMGFPQAAVKTKMSALDGFIHIFLHVFVN